MAYVCVNVYNKKYIVVYYVYNKKQIIVIIVKV